MRIWLLMLILFVSLILNWKGNTTQPQEKNFWQVLAEVNFKKEMKNGYEVEVPQFSKYLHSWNGKKVKLKGYIIPVGEVGDASKFMFSSLPFNVCYFCGAAGPETIMEIETTQK